LLSASPLGGSCGNRPKQLIAKHSIYKIVTKHITIKKVKTPKAIARSECNTYQYIIAIVIVVVVIVVVVVVVVLLVVVRNRNIIIC
jgi:heme/copper-type cytochrome/quinol oxidase subunit 2